MLRTTHLGIMPLWSFVEGCSELAECGKVVPRAVPIDSQDGTIPEVTCKTCREVAKAHHADREYFVVFAAGQEAREQAG